MNIYEIINRNAVEVGAELCTKNEALDRLIALHKKGGNIHNVKALRREINEREKLGSSAVSCRIAIAGVSHTGSKHTAVSALTVPDGVEYDAPDHRRVTLLFMIAGKSGSDEYIDAKARLLHLLMDAEFAARLSAAKSEEEFISLFEQREKARYSKPEPDKRYDCSKYLIENNKKKRRLFRFGRKGNTKYQ